MASLGRLAVTTLGLGAVAAAYGGLIERNAFVVRHYDVPVLAPGAAPLRLLHVSDLHLMARQTRKQRWVRSLAELRPDLVINTGDTISDPRAIPAIMDTLEPLLEFPGAFVPGNNDYYAPKIKNPLRYFVPERNRVFGPRLPWRELAIALGSAGWVDLTHARATLKAGEVEVAVAGTDDPHNIFHGNQNIRPVAG